MNSMSREAARFLCRSATVNRAPIPGSTGRHFKRTVLPRGEQRKGFHGTHSLKVVKPYLLADIGEGITECQVIQWFVKPGARVEQFDPICEVQSDKASVEITSRFDGVIKKLYYDADDMAKVGKPLVDIDIQSEISAADEAVLDGASAQQPAEPQEQTMEVGRNDTKAITEELSPPESSQPLPSEPVKDEPQPQRTPGKHASLATPAVRHMIKDLNLKIEDIEGSGRDGRVLKEDIQKHVQRAKENLGSAVAAATSTAPITITKQAENQTQPLSPIQSAMFKQMTRSLSIPHFLYTDSVDFTALNVLRKKFNAHKDNKADRLTTFPFIIKAVSLALQEFPLLNAHLDTTASPNKPQMLIKGSHNIGIAVDSPSGLLVPVIRDVQNLSIESIASEINRLSGLARNGKLTSVDLSGATFTLSNIGSIGGTAVAPVIVTPQVGILGIGRAKTVPAFGENGEIIKKDECVFSWSADHRVIDGAMAARCAEAVRKNLESIESMLVRLR